jgi:hypothetical protein
MVSALHTKDLVNSLGQSAEVIEARVGALRERSLDGLLALKQRYTLPAGTLAKFESDADRASDLVPFGHNPPPKDALSSLEKFVSSTYYEPTVAPHPTADDPFDALLDRRARRSQLLAMAIHRRPEVRHAVERAAVGKVLADGRNDGTLTIQTLEAPASSLPATSKKIDSFIAKLPPEVLRELFGIYAMQDQVSPFGVKTSGMTSPDAGFKDALARAEAEVLYAGAAAAGKPDDSVDESVLRLKRSIDKRSQALDLYSQALQAYNNAARNIVDKLRA